MVKAKTVKTPKSIIQQIKDRKYKDLEALIEFSGKKLPIKNVPIYTPVKAEGYKIKYLIQPSKSGKSLKAKWSDIPNYRLLMQAGIWIKVERSWKLYKLLHINPTLLRASNLPSLQSSVQAVFNGLQEDTPHQINIAGRTLRDALNKLSIELVQGHRVAINYRMKYTIEGTSESIAEGASSYVENFDVMPPHKTHLEILRDNLAANIRGYLAGKEVTFTNHKTMNVIFKNLHGKIEPILNKYGLEFPPDSVPENVAKYLLNAAGYKNLDEAKEFGDKKVIKDYEKILEYYMPERQLDAKLGMDEIKKVSLFIDYVFIPRRKRVK